MHILCDPTCLIHLVMHNKSQTKESTIGLSLSASYPKPEGIPPVMHTKQNNVYTVSAHPPHNSQVGSLKVHLLQTGKRRNKKNGSLCLPSYTKGLHCLFPKCDLVARWSHSRKRILVCPYRSSVKLTLVTNLNFYGLQSNQDPVCCPFQKCTS